jgi:lysophospholipase L1-like esterase
MGNHRFSFKNLLLVIFGILVSLILIEVSLQLGSLYVTSRPDTDTAIEKGGEIRILCLGESTTDAYWANDVDRSWPALLENALNSEAVEGIRFKVINEGHGSITTNFILSKLEENIRIFKPHIVISMMGVNDSYSNIQFESSPFFSLKSPKLALWIFDSIFNGNPQAQSGESILSAEAQKRFNEVLANIRHVRDRYSAVNSEVREQMGEKHPLVIQLDDLVTQAEGINPDHIEIFEFSMVRLYLLKRYNDCIEHVSKKLPVIDFSLLSGHTMGIIEECVEFSQKKNFRLSLKLARMNIFPSLENNPFEVTTRNYRSLHRILREKNITHLAAQYPLFDINSLKIIFSDNHFSKSMRGVHLRVSQDALPVVIEPEFRNIYFIDHTPLFKGVLATRPFDELFVDNLLRGGSSGHFSEAGHNLVAKSTPTPLKC